MPERYEVGAILSVQQHGYALLLMKTSLILLFLIISFLTASGSKNSAMWTIKQIGTNSKYYPKGFIEPAKWMKRRYHIKDRMIPIFSYCDLFLSPVFLLLGPINIVCSLIFASVPDIAGVLLVGPIGLALFDACAATIGYLLFRRKE